MNANGRKGAATQGSSTPLGVSTPKLQAGTYAQHDVFPGMCRVACVNHDGERIFEATMTNGFAQYLKERGVLERLSKYAADFVAGIDGGRFSDDEIREHPSSGWDDSHSQPPRAD